MTNNIPSQQPVIVPVLVSPASQAGSSSSTVQTTSFSYGTDNAAVESYIPVLDASFLTLVDDPASLATAIQTLYTSLSGNTAMLVLRLLADVANAIKKAEREGRWADTEGSYESMMKQATEIREAADKSFIGDICSAVITATVGLVGAGFGVGAYYQASKAATAGTKAQEAQKKMAELETQIDGIPARKAALGSGASHGPLDSEMAATTTKLKAARAEHGDAMNSQKVANDNSQASSMMTNALSITGQAAGGIPKAIYDHAAAGDSAQKTEEEANQKLFDFASEAGTELMQAIQHLFEKALEVLNAMEDARNQAFSQIATAA